MKKKMICVAALCVSLLLAGCGGKKEDVERINGSATGVNYRGVEYSPYDTTVTEEEVDERLASFCNAHAVLTEVTDRTDVQDGDTVNIDYVGYMDGEPFERGSDSNFDLKIGSGSFIPGFESGLVGAQLGTTVDVDLTFPDPYKNNPDFSGKPAVFKVTINKINTSQIPELTDELVAANTDYSTVEEYRKYIKDSLVAQKENYGKNAKQTAVMDALIESTVFEGIDQADIDKYYESSSSYYAQLAQVYQQTYGFTFDQFIYSFFGCTTQEDYEALLHKNAEREVKRMLILYAVADAEDFSVSDEEYKEAVAQYAKRYNITEEEFSEKMSSAQVREIIKQEKAEQLIYDTAVAKTAAE